MRHIYYVTTLYRYNTNRNRLEMFGRAGGGGGIKVLYNIQQIYITARYHGVKHFIYIKFYIYKYLHHTECVYVVIHLSLS